MFLGLFSVDVFHKMCLFLFNAPSNKFDTQCTMLIKNYEEYLPNNINNNNNNLFKNFQAA